MAFSWTVKRLLIQYYTRDVQKLEEQAGTTGKALKWIKTHLTGGKQRVMVCDESEWMYVMSRGPEGSVLGPVLFLVCVNDKNINDRVRGIPVCR